MTWNSQWPAHVSNADFVAGNSWSQHGGDGWEAKWWQCGACSWYTPAQKGKCRHCGIKKQWGLTASPPRGSPSASATAPSTPASSRPLATEHIASNAQETSAQIKALEGALAQVPAGPLFETSRAVMREQIATLKASISKSKPLGLRLESCRAAVARATKRKDVASEAVAAALAEEKVTKDELTKFTKDLTDLEAELAISVGSPQQSGDSVQNMTSALERVVGEMRSSPLVPANLVYQAELQMSALMEGVKQISALALKAAQAQAEQAKKMTTPPMPARFSSGGRKRASSADYHPTEHRRKTGKQPPTHTPDTPELPQDLVLTHRLHAKQPFPARSRAAAER
jgi:hypothetical protein